MKLIEYATDGLEINRRMDEVVKQHLPASSKIAFLPSVPHSRSEYFDFFKNWYKQNGYNHIKSYDLANLDFDLNPSIVDEFLSSDAIYLSGGNTFDFLYHLKTRGLLVKLQDFAKAGKVLIGISAGAMLMGPDVWLTTFYKDTPDNHQVGNTGALNLTHFDFLPHWGTKSHFAKKVGEMETLLKDRTIKTQRAIYACPDGSGLITWDSDLKVVGEYSLFAEGTKHNNS